eukprot:2061754-Prymnesium_polylepis.3
MTATKAYGKQGSTAYSTPETTGEIAWPTAKKLRQAEVTAPRAFTACRSAIALERAVLGDCTNTVTIGGHTSMKVGADQGKRRPHRANNPLAMGETPARVT